MVATATEEEPTETRGKLRRWTGRPVQFAHCGLIGVGIFGSLSDRRKLNLLEQRADELRPIVGQLEPNDPSRVYVKLVDAVADDDLLWRIYLPPHQSLRLLHDFVGSSSRWSSYSSPGEARNDLLRWRLEGPDESATLHIILSRSSSTSSFSPRLAKFLRTYWSELHVDIAGDQGEEAFSADQIGSLMTIDVPDHLRSVVEEQLGSSVGKRLQEQPLVRIEMGTPAAFEERRAEHQEASSQ